MGYGPDPEDFGSFYINTAKSVYAYSFLLAGGAGEDLAAEAYARALARWKDISGHAKPDAWVRKVVLHLFISRKRRERLERIFPWKTGSTGPSIDVQVTDRLTLQSALNELSVKQRAAIILRFYNDLPLKEIARSLGCTVSSANSHLRRGIERLRDLGAANEDEVVESKKLRSARGAAASDPPTRLESPRK